MRSDQWMQKSCNAVYLNEIVVCKVLVLCVVFFPFTITVSAITFYSGSAPTSYDNSQYGIFWQTEQNFVPINLRIVIFLHWSETLFDFANWSNFFATCLEYFIFLNVNLFFGFWLVVSLSLGLDGGVGSN
jgi:hypothetical protein